MSDVPVLYGQVILNYQQLIDYADSTTRYYGLAAPGTQETDAKWQIRKEIVDGSGRTTSLKFANGSVDFLVRWSQRATYSYS